MFMPQHVLPSRLCALFYCGFWLIFAWFDGFRTPYNRPHLLFAGTLKLTEIRHILFHAIPFFLTENFLEEALTQNGIEYTCQGSTGILLCNYCMHRIFSILFYSLIAAAGTIILAINLLTIKNRFPLLVLAHYLDYPDENPH